MLKNISMKEFLEIADKVNIIDIRNIESYNNRHIPNAKNIPSKNLIMEPKKYLNYKDTYYIYCQKGITSNNICNILRKQGFKVRNILGGYESWILEN